MARQTRQQRRARRAQQEPALAGGPPPRPPARPVENANVEPQPERKRSGGPEKERHVPGSGTVRFIQESYAELKKVEWPSQKGVVSGTAVVIIACVIVGVFLWLNDQVWQYVVQHIVLR
ncbi:MAG TPA: preprotein translocase subunit SecE [Gaiellaceae bacterium]|nr:preprotein translocase subunit SecE [Gaiellaceae bacterium]